MRLEAKELARRASIRELIGEHVALKRRGKDFWGCCPFHQEKSPSFKVNEQDGLYYCFGCRASGDVFDWVKHIMGYDFTRAREYLEQRLALGPINSEPRPTPAPTAAPTPPDAEAVERQQAALAIWHEAYPCGCTDVELYLQGRGIDVVGMGGLPPSIRYHRALYHHETRRKYAAMVAAIQGPNGKIVGVHRTYLTTVPAGEKPGVAAAMRAVGAEPPRGNVVVKAPVTGAKKMLGQAKGGAVPLAKPGAQLAIAEGIETALSVMAETGIPAWAALSLGNLGGITLPETVREVIICVDNDMKDPEAGEKQAREAAAAYTAQGAAVKIARPPKGMDFNDALLAKLVGTTEG